MKITAKAHSNIAFTKYWGRKNEELKIPHNDSISMNLSNLFTITTVDFDNKYKKDEVVIDGLLNKKEIDRVINFLDIVRKKAFIKTKAKVVSINNFPTSTGLSSSASGFAALAYASSMAAGLNLSEKELSILARVGSGSACRSIPNGFVKWKSGNENNDSFAYSIFNKNHWNIIDLVVVVSSEKKEVSTTDGQKLATTSVFFKERIFNIEEKNILCEKYIKNKDFKKFGELIEKEALEMFAIMLTSWPSLIYWTKESLSIIKEIQKIRNQEKIDAYLTFNTGQDIHVLCKVEDKEFLIKKINSFPYVKKIIANNCSDGTYQINEDLF